MRNSAAIAEDRQVDQQERKKFGRRKGRESDEGAHAVSGPQRSKTLAGRKLRVMTVEKGLLRETKVVQKMIDSLVECRVCPFLFPPVLFSQPRSSTWMT